MALCSPSLKTSAGDLLLNLALNVIVKNH